MRLIVDADPLVYRCGFAAEGEPEHHSFTLVKNTLQGYMERFGSEEIAVHLSGPQSELMRKEMYPDYKASRKDMPKPEHYDALRQYLIDYWDASVSSELEADDEVAMDAYMSKGYGLWEPEEKEEELYDMVAPQCVIISIDKDLDQVPGWHFKDGTLERPKNWFYYVDRDSAILWWAIQMLMGDAGDDIVGMPGIGPAKAKKMLMELSDNWTFDEIEAFPSRKYTELGIDDYLKTYNLITMVQDTHSYERLLRSYEEAADRESGVAGEEIQDPEVQTV